MSVLLWWLVPVAATLLALAWVAMRSRPSKPVDAQQGMADRERFRQAMSKPLPAAGSRRPAAGPEVEDDGDSSQAVHRRSA